MLGALIRSAGGYRGQGGTLQREFCVGKPSCCHAVGVLKVSHLCDLLARAQLWDWELCSGAGGCGTPSASPVAELGSAPLEQVRCLPGCIPCTGTVSVGMAELELTQPGWRLGVCAWECWSLEPLGAR